jgi:hypothetical protein
MRDCGDLLLCRPTVLRLQAWGIAVEVGGCLLGMGESYSMPRNEPKGRNSAAPGRLSVQRHYPSRSVRTQAFSGLTRNFEKIEILPSI